MESTIAIGHIAGSVVTLVLMDLLFARAAAWVNGRVEKRSTRQLAFALAVSIDALQREEMAEPILQHRLKVYSDRLLRNRVSDLCGVLNSIWSCIGCATLGVIFFTVLFNAIAGNFEVAGKAWWMIPAQLFFWSVGIVLALGCRQITGRYPGEARQWRRSLLGA